MTWSRIIRARNLPPWDATTQSDSRPIPNRDSRWSPIIKAQGTASIALDETAPSFETARARRMMEEAERTAVVRVCERLADAERRAAAIAADALERAIAVGEDAARQASAEEVAKLESLRGALADTCATHQQRADQQTLEVAAALARVLVEEELRTSPEKIVMVVRQVLSEARGARHVTLDASSEDARILADHADLLGMPVGTLEVHAEDSLRQGDVRVRTDVGTLDGRLTSRLELLLAALRAP